MDSNAPILRRVYQEPLDGRSPIRYRIQLIAPPLIEEATSLMIDHFVTTENLRCSLDVSSDEEAVKEAGYLVRQVLRKGYSIAALLEDDFGSPGPIISVNALDIINKDYKKVSRRSDKLQKISTLLTAVIAEANIFDLYNCSSYVRGFGLVVDPEYSRRGIAEEMLRARGEVCRMNGTPVSATTFSSVPAQRAAEKCGFESLSEVDLYHFRINGELTFRRSECRILKWMAMRYY